MALSFELIKVLEAYGIFRPGTSLLDVGTSNLYGAAYEDVIQFFERHKCVVNDDASDFAKAVAKGSGRSETGAALNEAWLGQLVEGIGMHYDSLDVAVGYKTRLTDLNRHTLPDDMLNRFDVVINCGTTEHILNQYNAFLCVHQATKTGGLMIHQVPSTGHTDHGYFTYTSRFFFDLAGYNDYEIFGFWVDGPDGYDKMYQGARSYSTVYPTEDFVLSKIGRLQRETVIDAMEIPNNSITIILRKKTGRSFVGMMELSTSWGEDGAHDANKDMVAAYR